MTNINELDDVIPYLNLINEICGLGTVFRERIAKYMLDTEFYLKKINEEFLEMTDTRSHNYFMQMVSKSDQEIVIPQVFQHKISKPNSNNILNEFMFWWIKFNFPSCLAKLTVNLLTEHDFRIETTISFITHYLLLSREIQDRLKRNVEIYLLSAQLYLAEEGTKIVLEKWNLLEILLSSFYSLLQDALKISPIQQISRELKIEKKKKILNIVDIDHIILHMDIYWGPLHDLVNYLYHKFVAIRFLEDSVLMELWLESLSYFQGIHLIEKSLDIHVEYDTTLAQRFSFDVEYRLLFCLWTLTHHLDEESTRNVTLKNIYETEKFLFDWLDSVDVQSKNYACIKRLNPNQITFNLPLHRFYSILLFHLLFKQNGNLKHTLLHDDLNLLSLISHPLQIQIGYYEILANMWIRNGTQIKQQAIMYKKAIYYDPDLFLMQLIMSRSNNHELFMNILIDRFQLSRHLKEESNKRDNANLNIKNIMLNGFLTFLAQMICIKPNLVELNDKDLMRREFSTVVCMASLSYSQIKNIMGDFYAVRNFKSNFDEILNEISDFKQPSLELNANGLKHSYYAPKDQVWINEYDPLYVLLRAGEVGTFQKCFERYEAFIRSKNLNKDLVDGNLWPPFRLPKFGVKNSINCEFLLMKMKILETKTLHNLIFNLLLNHVYEEQLEEKSLSLIIFLIELALYKVK